MIENEKDLFRMLGLVMAKLDNTESDIHEIKSHLSKILEQNQQNQLEFLKIQKGLEEVERVRCDVDNLRNNMTDNQKFIDNLNTRIDILEDWKKIKENRENSITENISKILWQGLAIALFAASGYAFATFIEGFVGKVRTIQRTPTEQLQVTPAPPTRN